MPRAPLFRRALPVASLLVWLGSATAQAHDADVLATDAVVAEHEGSREIDTRERATRDQASTEEGSEQTSEGGTNWGRIVGACLGVLFGGVLAVWQIRSMKNRS